MGKVEAASGWFDDSLQTTASSVPLLNLLRLVTPALPIGGYVYSQGLEYAVEAGWVHDAPSTERWLRGLLWQNLTYVDVPLLRELNSAWCAADSPALARWAQSGLACRESAELRREDHHLGRALVRLLKELDVVDVGDFVAPAWHSLPLAYSAATWRWEIPLHVSVQGYLWMWLEGQVTAAVKLVPLGQTAGQRLVSALLGEIPSVLKRGLDVAGSDIGSAAPGFAIGSALHETQYSRMFQS